MLFTFVDVKEGFICPNKSRRAVDIVFENRKTLNALLAQFYERVIAEEQPHHLANAADTDRQSYPSQSQEPKADQITLTWSRQE